MAGSHSDLAASQLAAEALLTRTLVGMGGKRIGQLFLSLVVGSGVLVGVPINAVALVGAGGSVCVEVVQGSPGDTAVVNITNTNAAGSGFGALRSSDTDPVPSRPTGEQYSSVNFAAGAPPNPNLAFVTIGTDGQICYDGAVASHNVILDVAATLEPDNLNTFDPTRILDTRGETPSGWPMPALCSLPASTWTTNEHPQSGGGTFASRSLDASGDLTSDGAPEFAWTTTCGSGAGLQLREVHVFNSEPRLLQTLPVRQLVQDVYPDRFVNAGEAQIADNIVSVEVSVWAPEDMSCCPSRSFTMRFEWNGSSFVALTEVPREISIEDVECTDEVAGQIGRDSNGTQFLCIPGIGWVPGEN